MSFCQVKFADNYLSLFDDGTGCFTQEKNQESEIPDISLDLNIQPVQFNKSNKRILIHSNDFKTIDLATNKASRLNLKNQFEKKQLIDIFWSQIEEDYVITSFIDKINLIDSHNNQVMKSFKINNLTKCKNWQSNSVLRQLSLVLLIDEKNLFILAPFVSNHFMLSFFAYEKLKEELPNIKRNYFEQCFEQNKNGLYVFKSLFGINVEPVLFPLKLNIENQKNIIDFSMKNDDIYVLFEDSTIVRLSIPKFPSFFDHQQIINTKLCQLPSIVLNRFISYGSNLFGIGINNTIQFFDECAININIDKQVINVINSSNKDNGMNMLILLFSDGSYKEIKDNSIYYESQLNERLKMIYKRKQEILKKKHDVQLKISQFKSEMSKLASLDNIKSLSERVNKISNFLIQTNENKDVDIHKIKNELPLLEKDVDEIQNKHEREHENLEKSIDILVNLTNKSNDK